MMMAMMINDDGDDYGDYGDFDDYDDQAFDPRCVRSRVVDDAKQDLKRDAKYAKTQF